MTFTQLCYPVFEKAIEDFHLLDDVDQDINNPYERGTIEYDLYVELD